MLPELKSVFLTADGQGITSTSANYLANLAKEVTQQSKTTLDGTSFLSSRIVTPLCPEGMEYERANYNLATMSETIRHIGELHTFCAWMREAIRAKETLYKKVNEVTFEKWVKEKDIKLPDEPELELKSEEEMANELPIGDRLRMLRAEAIAAAYGKMIHPDTPISRARKQLLNRSVNPVEKSGSGEDLTLTTYKPEADINEVEATFLELQNEQRAAEKELNSFKFEVKKSTADRKTSDLIEHTNKTKEWQAEMNAIRNQYKVWLTEESEKVNAMKIIVPDALKPTYEYLNTLGRKK